MRVLRGSPLVGRHVYSSDTLNRLSGDQASAPYASTTSWSYDAASDLTTLGYSGTYLLTDTFSYDPAGELSNLRVQLNGTLTHNDVVTSPLSGDRAAVSDLVSGAAASYDQTPG